VSDGLDVIESGDSRSVEFLGEVIEVKPLTIGQLPAFLRHAKPVLAGVFKDGPVEVGPEEMLNLIGEHGDSLCMAVAAATGKSVEHIGRGNPAEFIALASAIVAVNLDFFARRLAPEIATALRGLSGVGLTPSKP
jgi:hypothetical protein